MVTKTEMCKIMEIIQTAYPRYYVGVTRDEKINAINLWTELFKDIELPTLAVAVKSLISHFSYPPTIADIRKEIVNISSKQETSIDYWNEAYKMICNGLYMTEDEFNSHSEMTKKYFGNLQRLREKSKTDNLNLEVEQSLFTKYADTKIKRELQKATLPKEITENVKKTIDKQQHIGYNYLRCKREVKK